MPVITPTTWNPADKAAGCTLSNANLTATGTQTNGSVRSVVSVSSGKWYWEITSTGSRYPIAGVATSAAALTNHPGMDAYGWAYYGPAAEKYHAGTGASYGSSWTSGSQVIGVALDADAGEVTLYKDGVSMGVMYTGMTGPYFAMAGGDTDSSASNATANFGATALAFSPPSGYTAGLGTVIDPATATLVLTVSVPTIAAYSGGDLPLAPPAPEMFAYSGALSALTAPSAVLSAVGHDSFGECAAFLAAPSPTLRVSTGANAGVSAPSPTLVVSATGTAWGAVSLEPPGPTLSAHLTVSATASFFGLRAPSPDFVGYSGAVCSITLTDSPTITATGTTGGIASVAVACPLFELTSTATAQNSGSADLLAPSPRLGGQAQAWLVAPSAKLTAIGTAVVAATYEAYAINLKHTPRPGVEPVDEATRYTNFPFTHVVRYLNSYYGVNSTGLYLLEGTTDSGTDIPFAVKTAMTDFKTPTKKTLASAYFSGRFGPASTVQLHAGEQAPNTYSYATPRDALAQNHRQAFGRGLKERYFALGLSGTGALELDGIELDVHNTTRRI